LDDEERNWIEEFGINEESTRDREASYNALGEKELKRIGWSYGAGYVIREKPNELILKKLYENPKFLLYSLFE